MPTLAEKAVTQVEEEGTAPRRLLEAAQGVANQLTHYVDVHDRVEQLPEDDPARIETVRPNVIHSYVYEALKDGSAVCIYAMDQDTEDGVPLVRFKAFPSLEEASLWDPRLVYGWVKGPDAPGATMPEAAEFNMGSSGQ
jgi:hypothetical protein